MPTMTCLAANFHRRLQRHERGLKVLQSTGPLKPIQKANTEEHSSKCGRSGTSFQDVVNSRLIGRYHRAGQTGLTRRAFLAYRSAKPTPRLLRPFDHVGELPAVRHRHYRLKSFDGSGQNPAAALERQ